MWKEELRRLTPEHPLSVIVLLHTIMPVRIRHWLVWGVAKLVEDLFLRFLIWIFRFVEFVPERLDSGVADITRDVLDDLILLLHWRHRLKVFRILGILRGHTRDRRHGQASAEQPSSP